MPSYQNLLLVVLGPKLIIQFITTKKGLIIKFYFFPSEIFLCVQLSYETLWLSWLMQILNTSGFPDPYLNF